MIRHRCLKHRPHYAPRNAAVTFMRVLTVHFEDPAECPSWAWPLLPFKHLADNAVAYEWFQIRKFPMWAAQARRDSRALGVA